MFTSISENILIQASLLSLHRTQFTPSNSDIYAHSALRCKHSESPTWNLIGPSDHCSFPRLHFKLIPCPLRTSVLESWGLHSLQRTAVAEWWPNTRCCCRSRINAAPPDLPLFLATSSFALYAVWFKITTAIKARVKFFRTYSWREQLWEIEPANRLRRLGCDRQPCDIWRKPKSQQGGGRKVGVRKHPAERGQGEGNWQPSLGLRPEPVTYN